MAHDESGPDATGREASAPNVRASSQAVFTTAAERANFDQFTRRLIGLARGHLDVRLQHKVDPEDVVQSAYKSFLLRYGEDALVSQELDSLWSLLSLITLRKCADRVRHFTADRRNVSREAAAGPASDIEPWREAIGREPTPEQAAVLAETVEQMLSELAPPERPIVELSLQGYSTREVSERLARSERSVRRVRERVRQKLERE
jgi:RNA polymerase sigma-70 factor (ECF subfamily)